VPKSYPSPPAQTVDAQKRYSAHITTTAGTMTADLFPADAPRTVNNFVFLAREGFYDGVIFHRVIPGAMANAGPNTNGSQFFIMHADYNLPPSYTIFGKLTAGEEVVDAIANAPRGAQDRPAQPVSIQGITVTES
jgi:cyclophilin family peptidyl-prolyl cis-trans isomerase